MVGENMDQICLDVIRNSKKYRIEPARNPFPELKGPFLNYTNPTEFSDVASLFEFVGNDELKSKAEHVLEKGNFIEIMDLYDQAIAKYEMEPETVDGSLLDSLKKAAVSEKSKLVSMEKIIPVSEKPELFNISEDCREITYRNNGELYSLRFYGINGDNLSRTLKNEIILSFRDVAKTTEKSRYGVNLLCDQLNKRIKNSTPRDELYVIAEENGEVIGTSCFVITPLLHESEAKNKGFQKGVFSSYWDFASVKQEKRSRGIGRAMAKAAYTKMPEIFTERFDLKNSPVIISSADATSWNSSAFATAAGFMRHVRVLGNYRTAQGVVPVTIPKNLVYHKFAFKCQEENP